MMLNFKKLHFPFFILFSSFLFHSQAELYLGRSNHNAFTIDQRKLGVSNHNPSFTKTPWKTPAGNDDIQRLIPRRFMLAQNTSNNNNHNSSKSKAEFVSWIVGLLVGSGAGFVSGVTISVFVKVGLGLTRLKQNNYGISVFSKIKKKEDFAFLEKEDALNGLQLIGKGGCGEVYKAELPGNDGKIIAVKKIIQSSENSEDVNEEDSKVLSSNIRQIRAEIHTIGRIRHCNVLPLLAHVSRPDCHYLIYDFLKNGSLQDKMTQIEERNTEFNWLARYKIAIGVATGIEYLHMNNNPRIIHRDLKPGNILIDDDNEPKIADFGLAKEMCIDKTHVTASKVVGSMGYIAPEYHQTFKFTDKCDMYSFGVILGSLVIGKLPSNPFFQDTDEMHIVTWMRNVLASEDPKVALDCTLRGNGYDEQMLQVLKIACFCTVENPKERPNSKDVRCMLSQITH